MQSKSFSLALKNAIGRWAMDWLIFLASRFGCVSFRAC